MPLLKPDELSDRVINMLRKAEATYTLMSHAPEGSCIAVSALRGNDPHEAIKAMLALIKESKTKSRYALVLVPGDSMLDTAKLASSLGVRSVGVAIPDNVRDLLDSEPGGVSPFSFNPEIPVYLDEELTKAKNVYFSAGKMDESVTMPIEDFMRVSTERGMKVYSFSKLAPAGSVPTAVVKKSPVVSAPAATTGEIVSAGAGSVLVPESATTAKDPKKKGRTMIDYKSKKEGATGNLVTAGFFSSLPATTAPSSTTPSGSDPFGKMMEAAYYASLYSSS